MDGDVLYVVDALGQLAAVPPSGFGINMAQRLFAGRDLYLSWAWPRFGKDAVVTGFDMNKVRADLYAAGANKGLWKSVEKVRGLGAWKGKDGRLILHCGEYLSIDGKLARPGEIDGHFYPRRPAIPLPSAEPVEHEDNPAPALLAFLQNWNWRRPRLDPLLFLGWIGAGFLGGALPWRPSMFLIGDKAVGKSSLQSAVKAVFGDAIVSTPDTTPAGIYQRIGNDALPIAVDELEAEADSRRAVAVVKLARLAASGGLMLRGGQDHNGVEFQARSPFFFSAINPPPLAPQDLSRMAILSIGKLDMSKPAPVLHDPETIGARLLRRLADGWHDFERLYATYQEALRQGGHDSRGRDTYGIFLACAHLMLGDQGVTEAGYPVDDYAYWAGLLDAASMPERENARENWRACLEHLLTARVDAWRAGKKHSIGGLLEDLLREPLEQNYIREIREHLAQAGLGLVGPDHKASPGQWLLAVPPSGPALGSLFRETPWGGTGGIGSWTDALRQGPAHVVFYDKSYNAVRIDGFNKRCTLVALQSFVALTEES
ncbi:hypothetical protein [Kaistia sp. MMO-174]|uniref:hypothetical protein n=1 Tax=Kaistia sp. MMO-174 TaxID=3081256 RepID=UPI0030166725